MTSCRVGLWGRRRDPHLVAVSAALSRRGGRVELFDFNAFPRFTLASIGSNGPWCLDDILRESAQDLRQVDVLFRRFSLGEELSPEAAAALSAPAVGARSRREALCGSFQRAVVAALARRLPVVNPPSSHLCHRLKGWQHHLLCRAGIPTPSTVVTNDLEVVRAFLARWEGRVVVKPQTSGAEVLLVDEELLAARKAVLAQRPQMYQQLVRGRSFRLYALGGRIVALGELFFDRRSLDWRGRPKEVRLREADEPLAEQVWQATRLLNLPFCGIDAEFDEATEQRYFLDFNPGAYFATASRLMGLDLADQVAAYLLEVARRGKYWW